MSPKEVRGHKALRRGRWSLSGAEYFLTIVTDRRRTGLNSLDVSLHELALEMQSEGIWSVRTLVVMPDHLHLLIALGEEVHLSNALRTFKGRTAPVLRRAGLKWQRGYFDHRLREDEDRLPVFLYVFLNPYRAGLPDWSKRWPGYYCAARDWEWFKALTNEGCPFPEWLENH